MGITWAGMVAALLLFCAQFATIASVDLPSVSCEVINDSNPALAERCELSGFERHGLALLLVGLLVLALARGRHLRLAAGGGGARGSRRARARDRATRRPARDQQDRSARARLPGRERERRRALPGSPPARWRWGPGRRRCWRRAPEREDGPRTGLVGGPWPRSRPGQRLTTQPAGGTTSGSGRTPCSPGPSGRCRPCA